VRRTTCSSCRRSPSPARTSRQRHRLRSPASLQKALEGLLDREVVEGSSAHGYRVADVFFRAWMRATLERL
jgi:hypothetical protein